MTINVVVGSCRVVALIRHATKTPKERGSIGKEAEKGFKTNVSNRNRKPKKKHSPTQVKSGHNDGATNIKLVLPLFMLYLCMCCRFFVGLDLEWKTNLSPLSSDVWRLFCICNCMSLVSVRLRTLAFSVVQPREAMYFFSCILAQPCPLCPHRIQSTCS